jgi:NAD(P)-dependent dehydrogenase (short-subunit alcohol dehydrogenase family)
LFRKNPPAGELTEDDRLDGLTCLITGASSGLGKATAVELARRGGHIIMACRSGIPSVGKEIRQLTGNPNVEMIRVDLSDLESIRALVEELKKRGTHLHRVILNAGVVPKESRKTRQGFEEMFGVNYLANFFLVTTLLDENIIPNQCVWSHAGHTNTRPGQPEHSPGHTSPQAASSPSDPSSPRFAGQPQIPRIVFVSSETHRTSVPIDFATLGRYHQYDIKESVALYGYTKLLLQTFAAELTRRCSPRGEVDVAVHSLCPGAVNTNIAREAPAMLQPIMRVLFALIFRSPRKACRPVVYLTCSRDIEGKTGVYLHVMTEKTPSEAALDTQAGKHLWERSQELIEQGPPEQPSDTR